MLWWPTALSEAAVVLLLGGTVARRWLTPGRPAWPVSAWGLGLLAVAWAVQVGATLSALGFLTAADAVDYLSATATGHAMLTGLLGAAVLCALEWRGGPVALSAVAGAAALWGVAGVGHGAGHGVWMRALHAAHAGAMSVWVGGVLALLMARLPTAALAQRFTPAALGSVGVLGASGLLMGSGHLSRPDLLVGSPYGQVLLLKLGLVALTLLAALGVRRAVSRQLRPRPQLAREALLLVAVLGVTAALSNLAPPSGHGVHSASGPP